MDIFVNFNRKNYIYIICHIYIYDKYFDKDEDLDLALTFKKQNPFGFCQIEK